MYLLVKEHEYHKYSELLDQSFRLRKRIFADKLGWSVSVSGPWERDRYDDLNPAYLYGAITTPPGFTAVCG